MSKSELSVVAAGHLTCSLETESKPSKLSTQHVRIALFRLKGFNVGSQAIVIVKRAMGIKVKGNMNTPRCEIYLCAGMCIFAIRSDQFASTSLFLDVGCILSVQLTASSRCLR